MSDPSQSGVSCPDCAKRGKRVRGVRGVMLCGRAVYGCPKCAARWQNTNEPRTRVRDQK